MYFKLGVKVYKFRMLNQLILLAYTYYIQHDELILLSFGSYENFYGNLQKQINVQLA